MADGRGPRSPIGQMTGDDALSLRSPPHNFEAETQLIGAILTNNRAYEKVADFLRPEHFADDRHARIYEACQKLINRGQIANATTLKNYFEQDASLAEIGGVPYLAKMAGAAVTIINSGDHGRLIHDLYLRRQLIALGEDITNRAYAHDLETGAKEQIEQAERDLLALQVGGASPFVTARDIREQIVAGLTKEAPCFSTGFDCINAGMGGGLYAGKAYGIPARKKRGKTILAGQISRYLNWAGVRHAYLAAEMGPHQIEQRNLATEMGVNSLAFLDSRRSRTAFVKLAGEHAVQTPANAFYLDAAGITFDRFKAVVIQAIRQHKIKGFIFDYLQLCGGIARGKTAAQHYDDVSQWIADTCRIYGIWALVTAQINQEGNVRQGEGMRLAFDWVARLERDQDGEGTQAWLELMDTRYTRWEDVGSATAPAMTLHTDIGPHFTENQTA